MTVRVAVVVAACACALALPAAARAEGPLRLWQGAGVLVGDPRNLRGPSELASELVANDFTWVALQIHDGRHRRSVPTGWIQALREKGLVVGGWGVEQTHPQAEANLAASLVLRYGLSFYIADAEATYVGPVGGRRWKRSATFARMFRALWPGLPAALATFGAATGDNVIPLDYATWRDSGFELLPEAYYNQFPEYRPDLTVAHARRAGWDPAFVHPIVGVYHGFPAVRYVPLLRDAGTVGFSVFVADQTQPADYAALGDGIAIGLALPRLVAGASWLATG